MECFRPSHHYTRLHMISLKTLSKPALVLLTIWALSCTSPLSAADFMLKTEDAPAPESISKEIRGHLDSKVHTISKGDKVLYRFWFTQKVQLSAAPSSPGKALDVCVQPSLLGVVEVVEEQRDYRDDELFQNVFTIRYGIRPDDGNHLGTSDYRHFGVLIPVEQDKKLQGISGYKPLVKASSLDTVSDHPVILSLRPVSGGDGNYPALVEPVSHHHALRLELKGTTEGSEASHPVLFDIVFDGVAEF